MGNGTAATVEMLKDSMDTFEKAHGSCPAHAPGVALQKQVVTVVSHCAVGIDDIKVQVANIPQAVADHVKEQPTEIGFGPLKMKTTHAEWGFRFAAIVIAMIIAAWFFQKQEENKLEVQKMQLELRGKLMELHKEARTMGDARP